MTDKATHTPLPYECFQDRSYYDMWCVRRVNEREWGKGFHLVNGEEAAALRDMLNARAVNSHHDLIEALTPSGDTKAAYMGEFAFNLRRVDEAGDEYSEKVYVPWDTIKEIMKAILVRAAKEKPDV